MTFVAVWLLLLGMWPLAAPGHSIANGGLLTVVDLMLHAAGGWYIWRIFARAATAGDPDA